MFACKKHFSSFLLRLGLRRCLSVNKYEAAVCSVYVQCAEIMLDVVQGVCADAFTAYCTAAQKQGM